MARYAWSFVAAVLLVACGTRNGLDDLGDDVCVRRSTEPCACLDGKTGTRSCAKDGSSWSACSCASTAGGSGSGGSAGLGGAAGAAAIAGASGSAATGAVSGYGGYAAGGSGGAPDFSECWNDGPDACYQCCDDVTGGGVMEYQYLIIEACGCGKSAVCAKECKPYCSSQALDQPCVDCLNDKLGSTPKCVYDFYDQCQASSSCMQGLDCANGCQ